VTYATDFDDAPWRASVVLVLYLLRSDVETSPPMSRGGCTLESAPPGGQTRFETPVRRQRLVGHLGRSGIYRVGAKRRQIRPAFSAACRLP